jgi:holo-[acyl-carrier protein] synthase
MIEVDRVRRLRERHGDRFFKRILSPGEREAVHGDEDQYLASRFACKEAAMKALGTGWGRGVRWVDLEIANLDSGKPVLNFHGAAKEIIEEMGGRAHVSLSHLRGHAVAVVILEVEKT